VSVERRFCEASLNDTDTIIGVHDKVEKSLQLLLDEGKITP
jgi:hypothetical protein